MCVCGVANVVMHRNLAPMYTHLFRSATYIRVFRSGTDTCYASVPSPVPLQHHHLFRSSTYTCSAAAPSPVPLQRRHLHLFRLHLRERRGAPTPTCSAPAPSPMRTMRNEEHRHLAVSLQQLHLPRTMRSTHTCSAPARELRGASAHFPLQHLHLPVPTGAEQV